MPNDAQAAEGGGSPDDEPIPGDATLLGRDLRLDGLRGIAILLVVLSLLPLPRLGPDIPDGDKLGREN